VRINSALAYPRISDILAVMTRYGAAELINRVNAVLVTAYLLEPPMFRLVELTGHAC
jgi:hypothetical protein